MLEFFGCQSAYEHRREKSERCFGACDKEVVYRLFDHVVHESLTSNLVIRLKNVVDVLYNVDERSEFGRCSAARLKRSIIDTALEQTSVIHCKASQPNILLL